MKTLIDSYGVAQAFDVVSLSEKGFVKSTGELVSDYTTNIASLVDTVPPEPHVPGMWQRNTITYKWELTGNTTLSTKELRIKAYREEADPLFFKSQRGEISRDEWLLKVAEIKARYK